MSGQQLKGEQIQHFITAGKAIFTIQSQITGTRFTFRIQKGRDNAPSFVSVLVGPANHQDYQFLGTIFADGHYVHGRRSRIGSDAPSAVAFQWFWRQVERNTTDRVDVYHCGRCGKCGRLLTVPESIQNGIGPECAQKMAA